MSEAWAKAFLEEARNQALTDSKKLTTKIANEAWHKGRKFVRKPLKVVDLAVKATPLAPVAPAISVAIEAAIKLVDDQRKVRKKISYGIKADEDPSVESLRKVAKYDAKSLKEAAAKLEANQVKLKDAEEEQSKALQDYLSECSKERVPSKDLVWKAAVALYHRERYEDEILMLIRLCESALSQIATYAKQSRDETARLETEFLNELDMMETELKESAAPLQRSPSIDAPKAGYQQLK